MLLVKGFIGPDSHGGNGLFAGEDIPKGTVVWTYNSAVTRFISVQEYFSLLPDELRQVQKFSFPIASLDENPPLIGLLVSQEDCRYFNHSETPSVGYNKECDYGGMNVSLMADFATRDIRYGEELTCNYLDCDPQNIVHSLGLISCKSFLIPQPPIAFVTQDLQRRTAHGYVTS